MLKNFIKYRDAWRQRAQRAARASTETMADAVQKELGLEVDWPGLKTALLTATTRLHDKLAVLKVSEHLRAPEIVDRNPSDPPRDA